RRLAARLRAVQHPDRALEGLMHGLMRAAALAGALASGCALAADEVALVNHLAGSVSHIRGNRAEKAKPYMKLNEGDRLSLAAAAGRGAPGPPDLRRAAPQLGGRRHHARVLSLFGAAGQPAVQRHEAGRGRDAEAPAGKSRRRRDGGLRESQNRGAEVAFSFYNRLMQTFGHKGRLEDARML